MVWCGGGVIGEPVRLAALPDGPPLLLVVVDTEEEFDWTRPFDRASVAASAMQAQYRAQDIFDGFGVKPTYVIDYPVASTPEAAGVLARFHQAGTCQIGAHLHPWVNPPHAEVVSTRNSYPGNLPVDLEREKLAALGKAIEASFGFRPTIYKAGRYGVGRATAATLRELGYSIDMSLVPHTDFGADGGPDFRALPDRPHWVGEGRDLLEIPLSRGFSGRLAGLGPALYDRLAGLAWARLPGIFARAGLLERATLTPEGVDTAAHLRLLDAMRRQGHRVFTLNYHSPSLAAGHTPYVRSADELDRFLASIRAFLAHFLGPFGGRAATPADILALAGGTRDGAIRGAAPRVSASGASASGGAAPG